ncbi:MAG: helix-turn-helix transcriptional regulator [Flavobacteriales bacterium]|nr:helix-turn-helix transcriptional regulator [Flavobacteriales bacterium]
MIKNQKQVSITKERLSELQYAMDSLRKEDVVSKFDHQLATNSLTAMIEDLQGQLDTYNSLVHGNFHCLQAKNLREIPHVLIAARLAQKLSQEALGERLGLKGQQIQRYESTDYETASWPRIFEIATALEVEFYFEKIIILNEVEEEFLLPEGVNAEVVDGAAEKLRDCHSLIMC